MIKTQNEGKKFEQCFIKSFPDTCLVKRLNDNAASWSGGENTRFASHNECDFIIFDDIKRNFMALELKSTQGSLTYWRKDYEDKDKKQTFMIKKCQIEGLKKWSNHIGTFGFVVNFRMKNNRTFFIPINEFLTYTDSLNKKSINIDDVLNMNPIEIESTKMRTNFKYNITKFLDDLG